jgi:hypothetical protein
LFASLALAAGSGTLAHADVGKCQAAIIKAAAGFVQAQAKALQKCEASKLKGTLSPDTICKQEPTKTAPAIAKASTKLGSTIAKACGGKNKVCGQLAPDGDDIGLALIGWNIDCPNFENGSCTKPINTCADIPACIECIGDVAVPQAFGLYYGTLNSTDPKSKDKTEKALSKCQATIGKAGSAFLATKSKALAKCWSAVNKAGTGTCPDPKAAATITTASSKRDAAIMKACRHPDKTPFGPADIGFPAVCMDVTPPGETPCGKPVDGSSLQDLIDCVGCVTEFKVECTDRAAVPAFAAYPPECNPAVVTPTPAVTVTPMRTSSPTSTPTATPALTATRTVTPTPTVTSTPTLTCSGGQTHLTIPMATARGDMGWLAGHDTSASQADTCTGGTNINQTCYQTYEGKCRGGSNDSTPCSANSVCPGGTCDCVGNATCTSKCIGGTNHGASCSVATQSQCPGGSCTCVDGTTCKDQDSQICAGGTNANGPCAADSACPGGLCYAAHNTYAAMFCDAVGTDPSAAYFPTYQIHHGSDTNFKETTSVYADWFRFDTSSIPSGSTVNAALLGIFVNSVSHDDTPARNFVGRYYADPGTFGCGDWALAPTGTAAWSSSLTSVATNQVNTYTLGNVGSIVKGAGAKTAFRTWIDGGSPGPLCKGGTNNLGHCSAQGSTSECPAGFCDVGNDNVVFVNDPSGVAPLPFLEVCTTP